ncbi:hypothetical protein C8J56DRAFT_937783 [Mycena floridula]|nr:hypothetical protein C8J56DRAFT_937783 [Mycena floridula]
MTLRTKDRFVRLCISLGVEESLAQSTASTLIDAYSEPHRHYHTLSHISYMLDGLDKKPLDVISDKNTVELAIWFHDCVYDPVKGAPWNERESGRQWEEFATQSPCMEKYRESVSSLIECTISHKLPDTFPETSNATDAAIFLDLDISILAASPNEYDSYSENIRKEYKHYPVEDYRAGRIKVMQSFLNRTSIFLGPVETGDTELRAQTNLTREIEGLWAGTVPSE